jgi:anhydro-N-acetylmuramic acid kinase
MLVLGLMSGTSADGIDVALAQIQEPKRHQTIRKLLAYTTVRMNRRVRAELLRIAEGARCTADDISQLNFRLGEEFARAAIAAAKTFRVKLRQIKLVGSHGQTLFHQGHPIPWLGAKTSSTLQIGEPAIIAARTGVPTIGDFRVADMAVGGQGAPLVPFVDWLLLRDRKISRVALNLGGIANITVLPGGRSADRAATVLAFDTGPANILIDALITHFTRGRQTYDRDARFARKGQCIAPLLDYLLSDPYLELKPPKSTGREYYGQTLVQRLLAKARRYHARPEDLVRTVSVFTALSVVDALNRFVFPRFDVAQLIVSGGGARNPLIMAQLTAALSPIEVLRSSHLGVPEDGKEAYAFALLAFETWRGRPSNLPSATGAKKPAILGKLCWP